MAKIQFDGLADISALFEGLARMPDELLDDMLNAEGDVVVPAQKEKMRLMWTGPYSTGKTAESLKKGTPKTQSDGRVMHLDFAGSHHGTRNAEIAFINEYGKTNQPARPAIRESAEECADRAAEAAADALEKWINNQK